MIRVSIKREKITLNDNRNMSETRKRFMTENVDSVTTIHGTLTYGGRVGAVGSSAGHVGPVLLKVAAHQRVESAKNQ